MFVEYKILLTDICRNNQQQRLLQEVNLL